MSRSMTSWPLDMVIEVWVLLIQREISAAVPVRLVMSIIAVAEKLPV